MTFKVVNFVHFASPPKVDMSNMTKLNFFGQIDINVNIWHVWCYVV